MYNDNGNLVSGYETILTEDGELKYTNIYFEEFTYDDTGNKYHMNGEEVY